MKSIWKWTIELQRTTFDMPQGAKVLTVQEQHGKLQIWALVDPDAKKSPRTFRVCGTGHEVPDNLGQYIGTVQLHGGELVYHVFEAGK